jgi:hypothetical protein
LLFFDGYDLFLFNTISSHINHANESAQADHQDIIGVEFLTGIKMILYGDRHTTNRAFFINVA